MRYSRITAKLFIQFYSWYYMPTNVPKILIHGVNIMKYALHRIGMFLAKAIESHSKDLKSILDKCPWKK